MQTKIDNIEALKKRDKTKEGGECEDEKGPHLKRWAGKVTKNHGKHMMGDWSSGEWKVEITSKSLEQPVTATVNQDRKVGELVQFVLNPMDDTGKTAETFFEFIGDGKNKRPNEAWRQNMDF